MPTLLLIAGALNSPEMRHEIGEPVMDVLVFIEHEGRRYVLGSTLEEGIFENREDVVDEFWNIHDLGVEDLVADASFPYQHLMVELALRALQRLQVRSVVVPPGLGVMEADYLREREIEVMVDDELWADRRRRKSPWEIEGVERAQRAADTAMLTAARMLRDAERIRDGQLRFEGEILTAELIREAMVATLLDQGAESEEILVHCGDACLDGHTLGSGPILPDASCIIDCFPRDRKSGAYTDMTRTFVPGRKPAKLQELHDHCRKALDIALESIRPGADDIHHKVVDYFHSQGLPTREHHNDPGPLREGFTHSLGHGVGLAIHERPRIGRRSEPLVPGDVVAIEPGLYFSGVGGIRLEDTVFVTEDGFEHFTEPLSYDLEP